MARGEGDGDISAIGRESRTAASQGGPSARRDAEESRQRTTGLLRADVQRTMVPLATRSRDVGRAVTAIPVTQPRVQTSRPYWTWATTISDIAAVRDVDNYNFGHRGRAGRRV